MKKYMIATVLLLVVLLIITGCGKKEITSDSTNGSGVEKEYKITSVDPGIIETKKENVPPYKLKAGDKEYILDYCGSETDISNNVIDMYYCNVSPGIDDSRDGVIRVYLNSNRDNEIKSLDFLNVDFPLWEQKMVFDTAEEALESANEIAEKYIDCEDYVLDTYETENRYYYKYIKYVDEIMSEERLKIALNKKDPGWVTIETNKLGEYKDATLGEFDDTQAQEVALGRMKELYGDYEYEITRKEVCTIDGNIGITYCYINRDMGVGEFMFLYLE